MQMLTDSQENIIFVVCMGCVKLALTSPTGGGRSVGIVRVRTKATEFVCLFVWDVLLLIVIGY